MLYLQGDLAFKIFRVGEGGVVEDIEVGKAGAEKVDYWTEKPEIVSELLRTIGESDIPCDQVQCQALSVYIFAWPFAHVCVLRRV